MSLLTKFARCINNLPSNKTWVEDCLGHLLLLYIVFVSVHVYYNVHVINTLEYDEEKTVGILEGSVIAPKQVIYCIYSFSL